MCAAGRMNPFRAIFWSMRAMFSITLLLYVPVFSCRVATVSRTECWYPCLLLRHGGGGLSVTTFRNLHVRSTRSGHFRARELPSLLFLPYVCMLGTHIDQMKQNCLVWNEFVKNLVLKRSSKQHKTYSRLCRYSVVTVILDLVDTVDAKTLEATEIVRDVRTVMA